MHNIKSTLSIPTSTRRHKKGFTLIELMISIAIVAILSTVALPSMGDFLVKMRVDNEISEVQRLLLTARNMAINTGKNTTICPLTSGACTNNWGSEISIFTNDDNSLATNNNFAAPDELIKVKSEIKAGDKLQYTENSIIYTPDGRLLTSSTNFKYCPKDKADLSRGISVSLSGRSYKSSDTDNDGKDEDSSGNDIVCT
ncbi:GspH/FimT family pseudopilin [Colwellia sp. 4_MG-2023]|jgi:type IV fimbrial biogenesis protein FimT/type IV fimbrial biogenesis protein FimU|uniref:GspH/FimT family pseudopilin n=1 Tax=unclassified Colwellia TaxID=196834 RepID=UPI001C0A079F|nr:MULTISPECIES: GspH/FimT family pseudopilin [unclassified Colwellia]MBU2925368.1 GspH/FimT family pseudopilin [Colwellia sp. C2M11]MDO6506050.1 GspH/FimT family pseudopilin [Colwellia sp. 5_MG-2023]MDO6554890.1 GspH/FimT family pseudopilin [Colwellia sp. 4_MG-2023]MDO6653502.1 GspH/FimT family pseudopilin [Colwellia sp. 3_MG-2023]MDO6666240.1 GspH/FimT family pseudopilin [Colwellia sp. 2_MG-2023]